MYSLINVKSNILEVGKLLYMKNYVASNDGNISVRLSENKIMITPSGVSKGMLKSDDLLIVDMKGNVLEGNAKPSSEMKVHLKVYEKRSDIHAVVHAHPQNATAFSVLKDPKLDMVLLPEIIFTLGFVKVAQYGTPTTPALANAIEDQIAETDALLMQNHGALTAGKDVFDAYFKMESLEHYCAIMLKARILGNEIYIDDREKNKLMEIRRDVYGKEMPACRNCGTCGKITTKEVIIGKLDSLPNTIISEKEKQLQIEEIVRNKIKELIHSKA